MATQILTRKQRCEVIQSQDIEQVNPQTFFVKSQGGRSGYSVTRVGRNWACDCQDYRFRQLPCKHIYVAESAMWAVSIWSDAPNAPAPGLKAYW